MTNKQIVNVEDLLARCAEYMTQAEVKDIERAYQFAKDEHDGQFRRSGEPYIIHPVQVAGILVDIGLDATTIVAALLHDVVEDTDITLEELTERFGPDVAMLVDGVTKLGKIKYKSKREELAENHRKMFIAMAEDIRVILIKLADRLHNMRTLQHMVKEKQVQKAEETLEIFAPLAHRLGISTIKWELEDISLRYINPQQYYRIVSMMKQKRTEREALVSSVIEEVNEVLDDVQIAAEVDGRPKHIYSIYNKMQNSKKEFSEIYDLMAVRIIVDSIKDCYAVLGIIHTQYKPMPGRFKDYIAMPKPNMYQSLHTTVIGPKGEPLEVQIRTRDMHFIAEYGIAAHWAYKEGKEQEAKSGFEDKIAHFREILELQKDTADAEEFMESVKVDFFSDMLYVFTPKGDVIELPKGSVPIDYAYRIHTEIGHRTIGAKVNGRMVPIDYKLKTGDIIEIVTSKHSYGPSKDWLKICVSSQAKNKIRQWFKRQQREENVSKGRELIEAEVKKLGFEPKEVINEKTLADVTRKFNFSQEEDMYAAVGYHGLTAAQVAHKLTEKLRKDKESKNLELNEAISEMKTFDRPKKENPEGVRVKGIDNMLVRMSRCCNPVPGDDIVGYITRGRGVSIHRTDCLNVIHEQNPERLLEVEWEHEGKAVKSYNVEIEISGFDRAGLLNDVLQSVSATNTNIVAVSGKGDDSKQAKITMTIAINNVNHLQKVVDRIKQISDVYAVHRVMMT
ncbi:bifunctional (p)ppGpp synthetase/guanosine-3',5'-bis(diphosphate) 3'-pyrophosphohydrolase [uncultured Exiguobacterium sp.]|uniref:RelA/SpoT family protein n=1 Tax=uncultured Exiguobacterium sp. TaxID=202669 RepID=UPI0025CF21F6|nr:bifunctional (p)ppGpp synthetase/guanosine-3',5'-bis(diphosphate) 3'-pyrophosphohydrolase [uncultured Exiguobacterium sp.]